MGGRKGGNGGVWGERKGALCMYTYYSGKRTEYLVQYFLQGVDITFFLEKAQIFLETKILWKRGGEFVPPLSLGC